MSEAKTIVTENATAAELPERFRGDLPPAQKVVVTVVPVPVPVPDAEAERELQPRRRGEAKYLKYWGVAAHRNTSVEEAVARIRELRDEWDDR